MVEMFKIVHNNYEKISDELFWLSNKWIVKFNVKLNKYYDKYGRVNYHKEVMYSKGNNTYININRSYEYYITLESVIRNDDNSKTSIFISSISFYSFKQKLNMALQWFVSSEYDGLFANKDGKIFMPRGINPLDMKFGDDLIQIQPAVFEADNGEQFIGVNMYINKYDCIFINVNKFLAFVDMMNQLNMLQSAQMMLAYIGRPEPGENMYDMGALSPERGTVDESAVIIPTRKKDDGLGFFDRIKKGEKKNG